ncbi:MAG: glycosyltransferase, partial [Planctomycetota bacterium]
GDVSTANNLGVLYVAMGRLNDAKRCFEKALAVDANYEEAHINLEKVRQKLRNAQLPASPAQTDGINCSKKKLKIGFVSVWFERGQSYVTKTLRDVVAKEHETFVFARTGFVYDVTDSAGGRPKLEIHGYWNVPYLTTFPHYQIPPEVLTRWIHDNNLRMVIFNEEYDWNLVIAARDTGIQVLTYLDYYKEDWKQYMRLYDAVLCSTKRTFHLVKDICNAHYIGWGVDTDLFRPGESEDKKYTFFHNAGWLGINFRKMTPSVIIAFDAVSSLLPDATLFIHAQVELERLPVEVVTIVRNNPRITYHVETVPAPGLYYKGRILLFPSKLEGLGLPLLEGLACGLPAIATDAPPMNEFVRDGYNGLLVKVATRLTRQDNIAFPEEIIDMADLILKMEYLGKNPELVQQLQANARNSVCGYDKLAESVNKVIEGMLL